MTDRNTFPIFNDYSTAEIRAAHELRLAEITANYDRRIAELDAHMAEVNAEHDFNEIALAVALALVMVVGIVGLIFG